MALSIVGPACAQCTYELKTWSPWNCGGIWGTESYQALGLDNVEGWCGHRHACFPSEAQLPVYCPPGGVPQELPLPPGAGPNGAHSVAVNDFGMVVGTSFQGPNGTIQMGCIWKPDGTVATIPPLDGGWMSKPYAVNNSGIIAGMSMSWPCVWANGEAIVIPIPDGVLSGGYATDISDSGFVVGEYGHHSNSSLRGFRWRDGEFEVLEPAVSYTVCRARGVNDSGVAVGASQKYNNGVWVGSVAAVWTKDEVIALPSLPGHPFSYAMSINSSGGIIGGRDLALILGEWTGSRWAAASRMPESPRPSQGSVCEDARRMTSKRDGLERSRLANLDAVCEAGASAHSSTVSKV
ncbi:MAG: hypothetical protein KF724_08670 [Phycisphaeraceae bacterium]|nr:hypothetical protein [Phycisphaeraceae bacterium]